MAPNLSTNRTVIPVESPATMSVIGRKASPCPQWVVVKHPLEVERAQKEGREHASGQEGSDQTGSHQTSKT